jgi:cytidine deaminase
MTYAEMYEIAKSKLNPQKLNKHAKICDAVAVLESASGKIYVGVSLVATCGVGYCAEQAALSQMLNDGETKISKILVLEKCGAILTPCGRCIELLTQVDINNYEAQVFTDDGYTVPLEELFPCDWKKTKDKYIY